MKNERFIQLRKEKGLSQEKIAEALLVSVATIRNWENGKSLPTIDDMNRLAALLCVSYQDIVAMFSPETIKAKEERERDAVLANKLFQLFMNCRTISEFSCIMALFADGNCAGVIMCNEYVFPFEKIFAELYGSMVVFRDTSENFVALTAKNIASISPISAHFDVYTFDIDVKCPVFPTKGETSQNQNQKIRVSVFVR